MIRWIAAGLGLVGLGLVVAVAIAWGALVLYYLTPGSETVRTILAWGFAALGLIAVGTLPVRRARRPAAIGFAVAFALVLVVWASTRPSNDRSAKPRRTGCSTSLRPARDAS